MQLCILVKSFCFLLLSPPQKEWKEALDNLFCDVICPFVYTFVLKIRKTINNFLKQKWSYRTRTRTKKKRKIQRRSGRRVTSMFWESVVHRKFLWSRIFSSLSTALRNIPSTSRREPWSLSMTTSSSLRSKLVKHKIIILFALILFFVITKKSDLKA